MPCSTPNVSSPTMTMAALANANGFRANRSHKYLGLVRCSIAAITMAASAGCGIRGSASCCGHGVACWSQHAGHGHPLHGTHRSIHGDAVRPDRVESVLGHLTKYRPEVSAEESSRASPQVRDRRTLASIVPDLMFSYVSFRM